MAKKPQTPAKEPRNPNTYYMTEDGRAREALMASIALSDSLGNASLVRQFGQGTFGELDLTETAKELARQTGEIRHGNLGMAESMLAGQAQSLNAIFAELARRAGANMGEHPLAFERYMRLALKAQGQCRATLETLAAIKNPPVVYARQANIAHGPQQVNNCTDNAPAPAQAGNPQNVPNELMGGDAKGGGDGQRLDG